MSEQNSFGSVATKTPVAPVEPEESAGRSSRALLIAGGIAAVVLAIFAYLLFGSGGDASDDLSGAVPPVTPQPVASAPVDPATDPAAEPETVPKAQEGEGRNVFLPLEVQAEAEDTTGTTTGTTTDTTTAPTTDPVVVVPPPTTTTPTGETITVTLVSVKGDLVATKVGSTNYTGLSAGDTFGTNFQVYAIFNESCAGLVYGDDSFALCEGKSVKLAKL